MVMNNSSILNHSSESQPSTFQVGNSPLLAFALGGTLGIIPNIIIIVGIYRKPSFHKPTYYLIANLAICDLVLSIATLGNLTINRLAVEKGIPFNIHSLLCKIIIIFPTYWSYTASTQTLIMISTERYQAIFRPTKRLTIRKCKQLCLSAWIVSFIIAFPVLITGTIDSRKKPKHCVSFTFYNAWTGIYNMTLFIIQYAVPAAIMIIVYALILYRLKKKNNVNDTQLVTRSHSLLVTFITIRGSNSIRTFKIGV